jgi:Fe-S-cluster containining protein
MFRECGECTACCVWPTENIYGWEFGCGKSCKFLESDKENKKCSIYKVRPEPCIKYQCAWSQHLLPEEMRPDKCNVLVSVNSSGKFLTAFPINGEKDISDDIKNNLLKRSKQMNVPIVFIDLPDNE